jgi:hypothetical protein
LVSGLLTPDGFPLCDDIDFSCSTAIMIPEGAGKFIKFSQEN